MVDASNAAIHGANPRRQFPHGFDFCRGTQPMEPVRLKYLNYVTLFSQLSNTRSHRTER